MFVTRPLNPPAGAAILGKMVDLPNPPFEILERIFREAGLRIEPAESDVLVDGTVRGHLNGGLYIVPTPTLAVLSEAWQRWARWSLDRIGLFERWHDHVDQVAFALSVAEQDLPVTVLPREYNTPTHLGPVPVSEVPILLHYHRNVGPQLFLNTTGNPTLDAAIEIANAAIVRWRRDELCNTLFWSARYALHPELGSGVGSRGKALADKRRVVEQLISVLHVESVVDIGGGDGATLEGLARAIEHRATDVAPGAEGPYLQRNPDASFTWSDIATDATVVADLAICLDVVIHLSEEDGYRAAVRNVLASGRVASLISGFDHAPYGPGSMTHYHEPLLTTIQRDPAAVAFPLLAYDQQVAYAVLRGSTGNTRDARPETLRSAVLMTPDPATLLECVSVARRELGFFPDHPSRTIEYPWVLEAIRGIGRSGLRILDVGAGVNVLPLLLSDEGHFVTTVDSHRVERTETDRATWMEWGYLDYSRLRPTITSIHGTFEKFTAVAPFDVIYSISVIEHLNADLRRSWLALMASQLAPGGRLLLTIDLRPMSRDLWARNEGTVVEPAEAHGTVDDVLSEVAALGFAVDDVHVRRWLPESPVGVALINAQRAQAPGAKTGHAATAPTSIRRRAARARPRLRPRLPHVLRVRSLFDREWYLDSYPDVRASGMNPLLHYLKHGRAEGRKPTAPRDRS
jgi:2-polyprenyl-3-methyl-5-hydroxy-6-metoxy-1,4-benzoquinol methylase